jgi:hypothetical protein
MSDFEQLVQALQSNDNATRNHAEQLYNGARDSNPLQLIEHLMNMLQTHQGEQIRALSAVLLRRLLSADAGIWDKIDDARKEMLKQALLGTLQNEPKSHIRRKVGHTVAELASNAQCDPKAWPELLPFVMALSQNPDASQREVALDLLNRLCEYIGDAILEHTPHLHQMFSAGLSDPSSEVQVAALKATTSLLVLLSEPEEREPFVPLVPELLRVLGAVLSAGDELVGREALGALVDVAELQPTFLRSSLDQVGQAMMSIASSEALDAETRQLAAEFLLGLAENASGMMRKCKWLVGALLPLGVQLLCEVEDDPDWVHKEDGVDMVS